MRYLIIFLLLFSFEHDYAQTDSIYVSNTFGESGKIYFTLPKAEHVLIRICDKYGNIVETVLDDSLLYPGPHSFYITGDNFLPGTYIVGFIFGSEPVTRLIHKENLSAISSAPNKKPLRLSPNPAKDILDIPITGFKNIYFITLSGQLAKYIAGDATTVSLSDIPAGNYSVRVAAGDGKTLMSDYVMVKK